MSAPASKDMRVNYSVYVQNTMRKGKTPDSFDVFVNGYVASLKEQLRLSFRKEVHLTNAIRDILKNPQGCPMCDAGVLRNPGKTHWDDCPYLIAENTLKEIDNEQGPFSRDPAKESSL